MVNQINNLSLTQSNLPSGGSGGDGPHLFLDQTEAWRAEKTFVETLPALLPAPPRKRPLKMVDYENNLRVVFWEEAPTHLLFGREFIDLSRIPVKKGIKSRVRWTKQSDLYEIVHPSLVLIFLCLLTGGSGMRERPIACNF